MPLFPVTSSASFVGVGDVDQMTVTNIGDVSVYYKSEQDVDSGDTELAADASVTVGAGLWFVTASGVSQLYVAPVGDLTSVTGLTADATDLNVLTNVTGTPLVSQEITFTEVAIGGAATYTGTVTLPAGSTLVDIIVTGVALWDDGTSASLEIGNSDDPDGYFTAVDLLAVDLLATESLNFDKQGGVGGADATTGTNTHITDRYSAAAELITATVVVGDGDGTAGRTRVTVVYSLPTSTYSTAAVGVED
jgi:hypothetical protein